MKVPILKSRRIILRSVDQAHASEFVRWFSDKEVVIYLLTQKPVTLAEEKKWIAERLKSKSDYLWSVFIEKDKLIGNVHIRFDQKNKVANLGIVIGDKESWGKEYGYEMLEVIIKYAFVKLKCNRVELVVHSENRRAKKLYKNLGFTYEGTERQKQYNLITKKFADADMMSILRSEYKNK